MGTLHVDQCIYIYKGKDHPITVHQGPRGGRGIALLILNLGSRRGWVVSTTPRPLYPVPIIQEVWTCAKNLAPPGIDPRTVQPVVSCYTDWTTRHTHTHTHIYIYIYIYILISRPFLLRMRNVTDKSCRETQNTHFEFSIFFKKSCWLWDNVEKYCITGQATDDNMTLHAWYLRLQTHTQVV
jgi:hypothetical protein